MNSTINKEEIYPASLDIMAKIMTTFIGLLSLTGFVLMFILPPWYGGLFLFALCFIMLFLFYIYGIKGYSLTTDSLIIQRRVSKLDKRIPLSNIKSVRLSEKGEFKWTIRVAGNGGLWGYTGSFVNNKIGDFTMYATNHKNRVIITLKHPYEILVITPDDATMVDAINKRLSNETHI
jgi:hypothetical protein